MGTLLLVLLLVAAVLRFVVAPQIWDPAEEDRRALWRELRAEQRAELRGAWEAKLRERFPDRFAEGREEVPPPPPPWPRPRPRPGELAAWQWVGLVALGIALATYPIARGLTRRLERLRRGVESLEKGELGARVPVEGHDEVAELARRFNAAAARIEALVRGHKELLAHTSHELRTPLTRLRLGLESPDMPASLRERARLELDELNALIDQILLASRLDHAPDTLRREPVDLLAVLAEEAARTGADVEGESVVLTADEALLRRLVRNLLENAARHAPGEPAEARVCRDGAQVVLSVCDRGPGVAPSDRERVFEPFFRVAGAPPGGSGLGLALVQRIAQRHGGTARCMARTDGLGTCFEVRLPFG